MRTIMKRTFIPVFLVMTLAFGLVSCGTRVVAPVSPGSSTAPPASAASLADNTAKAPVGSSAKAEASAESMGASVLPAEWTVAMPGLHYTPVEPIAPEKVPVSEIELPENQNADFLKALGDGGCLAVSTCPAQGADPKKTSVQVLRVLRFAPDGSLQWTCQYDEFPFEGYVQSMCVFPDGGFAVGLRRNPSGFGQSSSGDCLFRFSPIGKLRWSTEASKVAVGALERLFALPGGALLTAGTVPSTREGVTGADNDVGLSRFEADGRLTATRTYGEKGYDTLGAVDWAENTGLVASWRSETGISSLVCVGLDLSENWNVRLEEGTSLYEIQPLPRGEGVLAAGTVAIPLEKGETAPEGVVGTSLNHSTLFRFDGAGDLRWKWVSEDPRDWVQAMAQLEDGRIVMVTSKYREDTGPITRLQVLSREGIILTQLPDAGEKQGSGASERLPGTILKIVPTREGGFTVILRQDIKTIPQPVFVSSIWMDTEAVVAHFDAHLSMIWRQSYNRYKDVLRLDLVLPTSEDRLMIG